MSARERANCREWAREVLAAGAVFLDTETTGLRSRDEVVEVAVVDAGGKVLFDSLVKPTVPIGEGAARVHGIREAEVESAPTFAQVQPTLAEVLDGRVVVIYNANYDLRMLRQSGLANEVEWDAEVKMKATWCAMLAYAQFWGEWNEYRGSYRWQRLTQAARQQGVSLPEGMAAHRALADAELTRRVVVAMAMGGTTPEGDGGTGEFSEEERRRAFLSVYGEGKRPNG